jgi:hypothetical protein
MLPQVPAELVSAVPRRRVALGACRPHRRMMDVSAEEKQALLETSS